MFPLASHLQSASPGLPRESHDLRLHIIYLFVSLILNLTATTAGAQWITDGHPVCTLLGNQHIPAMVQDGLGGFIVTWVDYRTGQGQVYAQRLNQWGIEQWPSNGVLICSVAGSRTSPVIVGDDASGAIIAWEDRRDFPDEIAIYAQRVSENGVAMWAQDGIIICDSPNSNYGPTMAGDGQGGAVVSWIDERGGLGTDDVYAQRINALGVTQWTENGVAICLAAANSGEVSIIADGVGGSLLAWFDLRNGNGDIYVQRIAHNGDVSWQPDGVVACDYETRQGGPHLVSDGAGGAIVVWEDLFGVWLEESDVYAQRINSNGTMEWPARGVALSDTYYDDQQGIRAISDGVGGAIAVWYDWGGQYPLDIRAQRIDGSGEVLWAPNGVIVSDAPGDQHEPTIVQDGEGGAIIAWQSGFFSTADIYAQRINSLGVPVWADNGIPISISNGAQRWPVAISDGASGAYVSWTDTRNGNHYDVYAQRLRPFGTLTGVRHQTRSTRIVLGATSPNPFSSYTTVKVQVADNVNVALEIFDVVGRVVRVESVGTLAEGSHWLDIDGHDQSGKELPSGVYFLRVTANGEAVTRKIVISR